MCVQTLVIGKNKMLQLQLKQKKLYDISLVFTALLLDNYRGTEVREVCDHAKHFAQHLSLSFDLVDHFVCTFHIVSIVCYRLSISIVSIV